MKGSRGTKGQMRKEVDQAAKVTIPQFESSLKELTEKIIKQGMSPKDAVGLNRSLMEGIYAQAYRLYNTGKYVEATHLFRMLILFDPTESKYVLGLAACFHMLKEYKNAIQTYTMCSILDTNNPIPFYHSSDCFIQMKDYLSASICLEMTIQKATNRPEFAKMRERAILSLESINKQQSSTPQTE